MLPPARIVRAAGVRFLAGAAAAAAPLGAAAPPARAYVDYKRLRENAAYVESNIRARACRGDVGLVLRLHEEYAARLAELEALRADRNAASSPAAAHARSQDPAVTAAVAAAGRERKRALEAAASSAGAARAALDAAAAVLPCDTHPDAPVGLPSAAVVLATRGPKRDFAGSGFRPLDHVALNSRLKLFDVEEGTRAAGSGFVTWTGNGVRLQAAIVALALDRAAAAGFQLRSPPDLAHAHLLAGCGFMPRDPPPHTPPRAAGGGEGGGASDGGADGGGGEDGGPTSEPSQVYRLAQDGLCLIGTGEVPLASTFAGAILARDDLPAYHAAVTHCFRREAGSGGLRDRGLFRLRQFTKVELFAHVEGGSDSGGGPQQPWPASEAALASLTSFQARFLCDDLRLHFRVLDMPTQELGAAAYRKIDMEAWMPGRVTSTAASGSGSGGVGVGVGDWGEVSSASNCVDYQARRLGIRFRPRPGSPPAFVHTLNGTAAAVPRLVIALLETHQRADGGVDLPPALWPYMGGRRSLEPLPNERGRGAGVAAQKSAG